MQTPPIQRQDMILVCLERKVEEGEETREEKRKEEFAGETFF